MSIILNHDSAAFFSSPAGMIKLEGAYHLTDKELDKVDKMKRIEPIMRFLCETKRWSVTAMDMDKNILFCNRIDGMIPFTVERYKKYFDYAANEFAKHAAQAEAKAAQAEARAAAAAAQAAEQQRQADEAKAARQAREAAQKAKDDEGESQ